MTNQRQPMALPRDFTDGERLQRLHKLLCGSGRLTVSFEVFLVDSAAFIQLALNRPHPFRSLPQNEFAPLLPAQLLAAAKERSAVEVTDR